MRSLFSQAAVPGPADFRCRLLLLRRTCPILLLVTALSGNSLAQDYPGLRQLPEHTTTVYYSAGAEARALQMANRLDKVLRFYDTLLQFRPVVTLLVLDTADWSRFTRFPVYGMPHYNGEKTLIVASADNAFWRSFLPPPAALPDSLANQIRAAYTGSLGQLSMESFFDLLAVHELGHAYQQQGGLQVQRKWMGELFCNLLLHTYIAIREPESLPPLTVFPRMVVGSTPRSSLPYTTLQQLEEHYDTIAQQHPQNYGWYQCRWHRAAAGIFDAGGKTVLQKLWLMLKTQPELLGDAALAEALAVRVHPEMAHLMLHWND